MSSWLVWTVSILYFSTGIMQAFKGDWWWFTIWSSYALANVGLRMVNK